MVPRERDRIRQMKRRRLAAFRGTLLRGHRQGKRRHDDQQAHVDSHITSPRHGTSDDDRSAGNGGDQTSSDAWSRYSGGGAPTGIVPAISETGPSSAGGGTDAAGSNGARSGAGADDTCVGGAWVGRVGAGRQHCTV